MSATSADDAMSTGRVSPVRRWLRTVRGGDVVRVLVLAGLYVLAARLGLLLAVPPGVATPVWAPTGISLAALLILGRGLWPGVFLGALLANLQPGVPLAAILAIATGNTLEAVVGATLLRRVARFRGLERVRDVIALVVLGAGASTAISAAVGSTALLLTDLVPREDFLFQLRVWWTGDALGDLIVAPLILAWSAALPSDVAPWRIIEAAGLAVLVAATTWGAFASGELVFLYLLFPLLIWCALRFGQRGVTAAGLFVSVVAMWLTLNGSSPFPLLSLTDAVLLLQGLAAIVVITSLVIAATVSEREEAEAALRGEYEAARLLQHIAVSSNEAAGVDAALDAAVAELCRTFGWPLGHAYLRTPSGRLESAGVSWTRDEWRFREFRDAVADVVLEPHAGLAGRALAERQPVWGPVGVRRGELVPAAPALPDSLGVRTGLALPVIAGNAVVAVLELFTDEVTEPDLRLLRFALPIGDHLGRVVERRRIDDFQRHLLATTSHEIRTPLAVIDGLTTVLVDDWEAHDDRTRRELLARVSEQARSLIRLVENLLTRSRIDAGYLDVHPEVVDVPALVRQVIRTLDLNDVMVDGPPSAPALADRGHLQQILTNYLGNAVKYGRPPYAVRVSADDGAVAIRVVDAGDGVPEDVVDHLFERFFTSPRPGVQTGTGLGLAIVRDLTRVGGGSCWYEPGRPTGACFAVRFPAAQGA